MSMISGQCDELRRIADKDTVPYEASDAMQLAADTIWELRCKLVGVVDQRDEIERLESENAKLRERYYAYESKMDSLVSWLTGGLLSKSAATPNDALYSVTMEQMTDELVGENFELESENAKLRKAAGDAWSLFVRFGAVHPYNLPEVDRVRESLQELGIEVSHD